MNTRFANMLHAISQARRMSKLVERGAPINRAYDAVYHPGKVG